jgi:apolipoprotein N-acyltransferase
LSPRKQPQYTRNLPFLMALPVVSGIFQAASFPKVNQGYLAWIAMIPLIAYLIATRKAGQAFFGGWICGVVQFAALLYWIPRVLIHYGGVQAAAAWGLFSLMIGILACYGSVACAVTRWCMNRGGPAWLLLFAPAWVALENVRGHFPFGGFPWLLTGYSQGESPRLLQAADIAGVYGVSFLVVWVNSAVVWRWLYRRRPFFGLFPAAIAAMLLILCIAYGSASIRRWDRNLPEYRAALLQGNLGVDETSAALQRKLQDGYTEMVDKLGITEIDLLILPESPSPLLFQVDPAYRESMRGLAHRATFGVVFNNIHFSQVEGDTRYYNSAYFLNRQGIEIGRYDKIHLVPFGEYIPMKWLFFFSETVSKDVGGFSAGDRYETVRFGGHSTNAIICFEAVFPEISREFSDRGSELLINLTNDGWYGDTPAPFQHFAMTRWRAVENRKYLLRAANSGISAVIAPSGSVQQQTALFQKVADVGMFSFLTGKTFYVRYGRGFPLLCAIITIVALIRCSAKRGRFAA